jgi:hypothetical protein
MARIMNCCRHLLTRYEYVHGSRHVHNAQDVLDVHILSEGGLKLFSWLRLHDMCNSASC